MAAIQDGKRVLKDPQGTLYKVDPAQADAEIQKRGWSDATQEEATARAQALHDNERFGGVAQTALGAAEKVARTASFGLLDDGGDSAARAQVLAREHPVVNFAAQAAGSTIPALVTGGAAGALGASSLVAGATEGLAAGTSDELEQSSIEGRPASVGNILLFGLGGELAGRAVPALLRRGLSGLAPATDAVAQVAGEAAENLAGESEARALSRSAEEAAQLPEGPSRSAAMAKTADQQFERTSTELSSSLEDGAALAAKADAQLDKLAPELVSEDSPAQMTWANDTAKELRAQADKFPEDPRGITSKSGRRVGRGGADESWKGTPKQAESYDARIAAYKDDPEFINLLQEKAADTRRTPFGPGKERELWELQKDVLEENEKRFPKVKSPDAEAALNTSVARQTQSGSVVIGGTPTRSSRFTIEHANGEKVGGNFHTRDAAERQLSKYSKHPAYDTAGWTIKEAENGRAQSGAAFAGDVPEWERSTGKALPSDVQDAVDRGVLTSEAQQKARKGFAPEPTLDPVKVTALRDQGGKVVGRLSDDELDAVRSFTSRGGDKVGTPEWDSAVDKLTVKNPTDAGPLYRGTRMPKDQIESLLSKGEWSNKEPTSFSYNKDLADAFGHGREARGQKVLFQVNQLDEGANFLHRQVGVGRSGLEREINIAKPTKLRVIGSTVDDEGTTVIKLASRGGEQGSVSVGQGIAGVLGSPMGNVAMAGAGGAAGGALDGKEGAVAGGVAGLAASLFIGGRAHRSMLRLADDLLETKGGADTFRRVRAGVRELEAAGAPAEAVKTLRDGLKAKELWGQAAEVAGSLQSINGKAIGAKRAIGATDAETLRAHLSTPPTSRGAAGAGLHSAVESLEDVAQVASKAGLLGKGPLGKLVRMALKARRALGDADAVFARGGTETRGAAGASVVDAIAGSGGAPVAGAAVWGRIDEGAKQAIKGAARRMARPVYDDSLSSARAVLATSALTRFKGDYSTPEQSFAAKTALLDKVRLQPTAIPLAIAQSTGTLHKDNPRLFQQLAARVASQFAYVSANLPTSMSVSMVYPRGVAPSRSQLTDYAELWNSTFHPETVLDDLSKGQASPAQMRVLKDVHPDVYQQTQEAVLYEVANSYAEVPTQRKQQLDILFGTDGVAGPCFTWRCSDYIEESNDAAKQRGAAGPAFEPEKAGQSPITASSLNAIRSGVTNRGA